MLLELIDEARAIRIDLFRALGSTHSRAATLDAETGALDVVSVEDLVARTTALVCGSLRRGKSVDVKQATALTRLLGLGRPEQLAAAWNDHRQQVPGTFVEEHFSDVTPCVRCRAHGPFRPAPSGRIVEILGYF
jgi:hypothetical protein